MSTKHAVVNSLRNRFWQWVARRAPKAPAVTLQHKSIYVFPGRQGVLFIFVLGLMWLLGTNYENNLILAAAFLLMSMMIVSVVHAFRNLAGLRFTAIGSQPVFAGDYVRFDVLLEACLMSCNCAGVMHTFRSFRCCRGSPPRNNCFSAAASGYPRLMRIKKRSSCDSGKG